MNKCENVECDIYPDYGPAPHDCFYKIGTNIGESVLKPKNEWPDNFEMDPECTGVYPDALGIYYCPTCRSGMMERASEPKS